MRVLVVSSEPVGELMAGPAIRALELARVLSEHCQVSLAAPGPSDVGEAPIELVEAGFADFSALLEAVRRHDVVVAQQLPPQLLRYIARMPVRLVADLYNPLMIEVLEAGGTDNRGAARRVAKAMLAQSAAADFVICASEKQRDLWLGGMALAGLIDADRYRVDPTFRSFIDVVPFGVPDRAPSLDRPVLKGVWPGIGAEDRVLLWAGGIWRWLDPLTPIRAVELLCEREHDTRVHLVFLGTDRPASEPGTPSSAPEAVSYARERGLAGQVVHFNDGWVPYDERQAFLLESDLGVCAHHDHLEARFSFRTRVLDHLWAGLPSVLTGGDAVAELVERRRLGRVVSPGDTEGFATACAALLDDAAEYRDTAERIRAVAPRFRWSEAARPLIRYCLEAQARSRRRVPRAVLARATYGQYPDILADIYERGGAAELVRRVPQHFARLLRHRT